MNLTLRNLEEVGPDDVALVHACIDRAMQHQHVVAVSIQCAARNREGWLEFIMMFGYDDGGTLTVGALQRKPGEPFEFHS